MPFKSMSSADLFSCKKCGECCKGFGGTVVTEADIQAIAAYINADEKQFVKQFCQMSGSRPVLGTGRNGYCIFWDKICTIHPVKPRMCREWPFIGSVLKDVGNWHIMAGFCEGMRTDFPDDVILECAKREIGGG